MRGMRERATLIGASLTIDENPVESGTRVRLEVPTEDHEHLHVRTENGR